MIINLNYIHFINKINKNNIKNENIKNWYKNQKKLLEDYFQEINETIEENEVTEILILLFNKELKEKNKITNLKTKYNYFRKTLKKKLNTD
jgi:predicted metal-dependent hydrolase